MHSSPPNYRWPKILSNSPYTINPAPPAGNRTPATKAIWQYTPLAATISSRSSYFDMKRSSSGYRDRSNKDTSISRICDACARSITPEEPRFLCCDCPSDFDWCWHCMTNPEETHNLKHTFVRIDANKMGQAIEKVSYADMNTAVKSAKSLVASVKHCANPGTPASLSCHSPVISRIGTHSESGGLRRLASRYWYKPSASSSFISSGSTPQAVAGNGGTAELRSNSIIEITADVLFEVRSFRIPMFATLIFSCPEGAYPRP